jgi:hypothetical protein
VAAVGLLEEDAGGPGLRAEMYALSPREVRLGYQEVIWVLSRSSNNKSRISRRCIVLS